MSIKVLVEISDFAVTYRELVCSIAFDSTRRGLDAPAVMSQRHYGITMPNILLQLKLLCILMLGHRSEKLLHLIAPPALSHKRNHIFWTGEEPDDVIGKHVQNARDVTVSDGASGVRYERTGAT